MDMRKTFQKIANICKENSDSEGLLGEIYTKCQNRLIRYDWEERYGIRLDSDCKLAEYDCYHLGEYELISYFKDGYKSSKEHLGRSISWPEKNRQPVNEWIYSIGFSTGAYIFGDDYESQKDLFMKLFEELRTYKPDYEDLHNHFLYWNIKNSKKIIDNFKKILNKYRQMNTDEIKTRKIKKMKKELELLTGEKLK